MNLVVDKTRDVPVTGIERLGPVPLGFAAKYLWAGALLYAAGLTVLALMGVYVFIVKTLICPLIVVVGVQLAGARTFARDWATPFAVVALFDAGRAFVFALIVQFHLPIYATYVIEWERACFGAVLPVVWQHALRHPLLDAVAVIVHGSHFGYFLVFGFVVWWFDRQQFVRWANGLSTVIVGGLATYLLIPTVPPWMAAHPEFGLLPPLEHIVRTAYTHRLPVLLEGFDVNTIAAMPSLHVAFPAYCAFVGWRIGGFKIGVLLAAYTLLVSFSAIYLGQHYGVDALAGAALAFAGYEFGFRGRSGRADEPSYRTAAVFMLVAVLAAVGTGVVLWTR